MKKIFLALLLVCSVLTSCDMDKRPWGSLDDVTGVQNVNDIYRYRNNFYNVLKSVNSGWYFAYPDIQMDQFMGIISNGNREVLSLMVSSTQAIATSKLTGLTAIAASLRLTSSFLRLNL